MVKLNYGRITVGELRALIANIKDNEEVSIVVSNPDGREGSPISIKYDPPFIYEGRKKLNHTLWILM